MAKLQKVWIESYPDSAVSIRFDWDNDRHQRVEFLGSNPLEVIETLRRAQLLIEAELHRKDI